MNVKQLTAAGYTTAAAGPKPLAQKPATPPSAESKSMQVALSAGSQSLHEGDKDIDMDRVNAIREALASGTLTINPQRIAQGLIDSVKDFS